MMTLYFPIYTTLDFSLKSEQLQIQLEKLGVATELHIVENMNAKFLRQHPQSSLIVDADGVWLAEDGMKMQPAWQDEIHRLKRSSLKNELLARACNLTKAEKILDATAGLGHDGLLMAWFGARVTMLERHPVLFVLLQTSLELARQHPVLQKAAERIELIHTDAVEYLKNIQQNEYDVIYLDPMFPQRDANQKQIKKQAAVKKQMQLLHRLLADQEGIDLGNNLLELAQNKAIRTIVKRPKHAVFLNNQMPQHQWQGDACRFDAYFSMC